VGETHVLVCSTEGKLYGWGSTKASKLLQNEASGNIYSPTEIPFFNPKKMKILDLATSQTFSMVLVEDIPESKKQLYKQSLYLLGGSDV